MLLPANRPPGVSTTRPSFYHRDRDFERRHGFEQSRGAGIIAYPVVIGPAYWPEDDFLDQPYDDVSAAASQSAPPPPDNGYYPEAPAYEPTPPPRYQAAAPPAPPASPEMQYVPGSADTVTLIFKDGRPLEQIQNYLATRTTLTVIDGRHHHDIPLSDLDIPATVKANRETGVGFQVPAAP